MEIAYKLTVHVMRFDQFPEYTLKFNSPLDLWVHCLMSWVFLNRQLTT